MKGALILPFAPKRGFDALNRFASVRGAIVVLIVVTGLCRTLLKSPSSWGHGASAYALIEDAAFGLLRSLLSYMLIVIF
jgi:hypothetical protein